MSSRAVTEAPGRRFTSLRMSLTASCNFACTYCVPDARRLVAKKNGLDADDFVRALQLLMHLGIEKLRITGGEPLLFSGLERLLGRIRDLPLKDRAMTTNGALLSRCLPMLIRGGIRRLNVSLDSLIPEVFTRLSRGGDLNGVLQGLRQAKEAGMDLRINTVLLRGQNDGEILPLLDYCMARNMEVRFIELMRMGHLHGSGAWREQVVLRDRILDIIAKRYSIEAVETPADATAECWLVRETGGRFGIIANTSAPFCAGCNRLRLTSDGRLYGCMSSSRAFDMRDCLALPDSRALARLKEILPRALATKSVSRFDGETTVMKFLGG